MAAADQGTTPSYEEAVNIDNAQKQAEQRLLNLKK